MSKAKLIATGVLLLILSIFAWPAGAAPDASRPAASSSSILPAVGHAAPQFALAGSDSKQHSLSEFRGRTVVLYFFCGCVWCQQCAQAWGQIQRSGALAPQASSSHAMNQAPVTLVVYAGDSQSARDFARQQGLDPSQTVLLPDIEMEVTDNLYHAEPCPRVVVIDPKGIVRYVNDHKNDTPRVAPAMAIVSRVMDSVRACQKPVSLAKP